MTDTPTWENEMRAVIAVLFFVWFVGLFAGLHRVTGGAIHLLLLAALVIHLVNISSPRA